MHITVECPRCQNRYQLDPGLRGRRMRCLNTICQAIFEVQPGGESPEAAPSAPADGVPEPTEKPVEHSAQTAWAQAPPPVRGEEAPATAVPADQPDLSILEEGAPDENPPASEAVWSGEAPPRRAEEIGVESPAALESAVATEARPPSPPAPPRHRHRLAVAAGLLGVLVLLAGAAWWLAGLRAASGEMERAQKADEQYRNQEFTEAAASWQRLQRDFPRSDDYAKYGLLAELSAVRGAALAARAGPAQAAAALQRVLQFVEVHQNNSLLAERRPHVFLALRQLTQELTDFAERNQDGDLLALARGAWTAAEKFPPPPSVDRLQAQREVNEAFARLDKTLAARRLRWTDLRKIKDFLDRPTVHHYLAARDLVRQGSYQDDAEFAPRLAELLAALPGVVTFMPTRGPDAPLPEDDLLPSLAVTPRLGGRGKAPSGPVVVTALARGVLYALDPIDGGLRWARRLGIDAATMPVRLPADLANPERLLVVTTDHPALLAVETATGRELWRTSLDAAAAGPPVMIGQHALVATRSGRVEEIETTGGRRAGFYQLDQPLVGAAHQEGTTLVYVAGERFAVYVLDVSSRRCVGLLASDHAAGDLRQPPQVLAGAEQGYLLLTMAQSTGGLELRGYDLAIKEAMRLTPSVHVPGGSDFQPWPLGDKLAMTTDTGRFLLFGINQKGQRDPWLFPWVGRDYVMEAGPAQIVHAHGPDFWIGAGGRVHRLELLVDAKEGPKWLARWPAPPSLGRALHSALAWPQGTAPVALMTPTQTASPTVLATALDAHSGALHWQRQLGLTWQGSPMPVGSWLACPGLEGVVFFERALALGSLTGFQARGKFIAGPLDPQERRAFWPEKNSLLDLRWAATQGGGQLRWRTLSPESATDLKQTLLPAAPAGTPLPLGDSFLAPLANGQLARIERGAATLTIGPSWRALGAEEEHPCVSAALNATEFVTTDGRRGLTRWQWLGPKNPARPLMTAEQLDHRVLAIAVAPDRKSLAIRDVADQILVLDVKGLGVDRQWQLGGKITAGPFFLGKGLAAVVEGKRLVWLDPSKDGTIWDYRLAASLVDAPILTDGLVIAADQAGHFIALDPATGATGPGYTLRANVAPAVAPVPCGDGQLLVPLCDGTAVVLPLAKLKKSAK